MTELGREVFIPLLGMLLSFGLVIAIVVILSRARQRRIELQVELQSKLIEKFGSTAELMTFLESSAGRQFVSGVQSARTATRNVMAVGIRRAIIVSFLGTGFIALWLITDLNGLAWPGVLFLSLGIGYYVAAMVTSRMDAHTSVTLPPTPPPTV
jgi:hypothetical protein